MWRDKNFFIFFFIFTPTHTSTRRLIARLQASRVCLPATADAWHSPGRVCHGGIADLWWQIERRVCSISPALNGMIVVPTRRLASKDAGMKTWLRQENKEGREKFRNRFVILDCLRGVSSQGELSEVKQTGWDQIADASYRIFAMFILNMHIVVKKQYL